MRTIEDCDSASFGCFEVHVICAGGHDGYGLEIRCALWRENFGCDLDCRCDDNSCVFDSVLQLRR